MGYENLLVIAEHQGLYTYETSFRSKAKGLIAGNIIGIDRDIPVAEKACVLAEELGHYHTNCGNIIDQTNVQNRKQELRARQWAYEQLVPLPKIVQAYHDRIPGHELSEYLGITEDFLQNAISRYREKHGTYATFDRYTICFDPLGVIELYH